MKSIRAVVLSAALVALMGVVGVASASAAQFQASSYPAAIGGEQGAEAGVPAFGLTSGSIKCTQTTPSGTASGPSSSLSVTFAFSGCKAFGLKATVKTNSCGYTFKVLNDKHPYTGTADIACSKPGDSIEFATAGCTAKLPAQTGLSPVEFVNMEKGEIAVNHSVSNLKYTEGFGESCAAPGEHTNGTYSGTIYLDGVNVVSEAAALFEGESYPLTVKGQSTAEVVTNTGAYTCSSFSAEGTLSAPTAGLKVVPAFGGCKAMGVNFPVSMNGCYFVLRVAGAYPWTTTSLDIACEKAGEAISFVAFSCKTQIPAQSGLGSVSYASSGVGATRAVTVNTSLTGIKYTEASGENCSKPGTHTNGSINVPFGSLTLKGFSAPFSEQRGIWVG